MRVLIITAMLCGIVLPAAAREEKQPTPTTIFYGTPQVLSLDAPCDGDRQGMLRYAPESGLQLCNGDAWQRVVTEAVQP